LIGEGQTISQPYIVAEMTQALRLSGVEKVLEIGTGSGYQTAILCRLAGEVVTVERIPSLLENARKILLEPDPGNVRFRIGDGTIGVPEEAPFHRIIVTAASPKVPTPLFEQLAEGGIMVIPVGGRREQELLMVRKERGVMSRNTLGGCRFVPLIGQCGFHE
jgi:protein-L-isoaspartate(D-aspartate) O-methyltransferase